MYRFEGHQYPDTTEDCTNAPAFVEFASIPFNGLPLLENGLRLPKEVVPFLLRVSNVGRTKILVCFWFNKT